MPERGVESSPEARPDPHIGLIAGPVEFTRASISAQSSPGLVAVSLAAVVAMAAVAGRLLTGAAGFVQLAMGVLVPILVVATFALAQRRANHRGSGGVRRFKLRASTGASTVYTLRCDAPRDVLQTGDLVRVLPGRRDSVRAVEVLATMNGPVVRRVQARPAVPPIQLAGFAVAAVMLAATAVVISGAR